MNKSAIYIHVPWCRRRCPYCNFYLVVGRPKDNFIDAIVMEWQKRNFFKKAGSLYFGGGTPSLLPPEQIEFLINYFLANDALMPDAEITLEANPEDLSDQYLAFLAHSKINRISLGVQSFQDEILRVLGRKHTGAMAQAAVGKLKKAGKDNISVDLIVGVAGEKPALIEETLNFLDDHGVPHISAYLLTIEEGTQFFHRIKAGKIRAPLEDDQADIYGLIQKKLLDKGYLQYDISSYAKPGFFSQHNQIYWAGGQYLGLGPGAHSMGIFADGGVMRSHNVNDLSLWLKNPAQSFISEPLSPKDALLEALTFGLRNMAFGVNPQALSKRHQTAVPPGFYKIVKKLKDRGWLAEEGALRITPAGALFADAIMRDLLLMEEIP